jgi:CRISPR-associated endonuclease/helicase Cas3
VFLPDEEEEGLHLHRVVDGQRRGDKLHVLVQDSLLHREPLDLRKGTVTAWGQVDLLQELVALAESKGMSLQACAARYATASLPEQPQGWRFHAFLGLVPKR